MEQKVKSNLDKYCEYFKILANPTRLCILCNKKKKKKVQVSKLTSCSAQSLSYISQELNKLKKWNIVNFEKQGLECYYYLTDKNICNIIQSFNLLPENKE